MISTVLDVASWALLSVGILFMLTGALGMLRLPDVFTRLHAAGMTDTMGAGLILIGLCLRDSSGVDQIIRLVLILLFLWFTSPISTHAVAKAALSGGIKLYNRRPSARPADGAPAIPEEAKADGGET